MQERIREASTVVLHREGRVFLVERSPTQRWFPSVWAFPGGTVDPADREGTGEAAFRVAALRELHEETGLRVADAARLQPAGRLLTPPFGPVRFDTCFFALALRDGEEPKAVVGELVGGRWWDPAEAVAAYERGALPLAPPTLALLRRVARDGVGAFAAMALEDGTPHHRRFRIEVHPGVYTLPLRTRTLPPATTTNVAVYGGDRVLVVDPGPSDPEQLGHLYVLLDALHAEGKRIAWVALTHHHPDHVGGVVEVAERYHAEIAAHAETVKRLPIKVDRALADGDAFDLGTHAPSGKAWRVEALHTPGHAPGHVAFVDRRWDHVVAGDLVSGVSTILVDPHEGDMTQYFASLERLIALDPAGVLPAHGPPQVGKRVLVETLAHRRMREAKVVEALGKGLASLEAMLPFVYADADPAVWPLAEKNLASHLAKLEREKRARRDGDAWRSA